MDYPWTIICIQIFSFLEMKRNTVYSVILVTSIPNFCYSTFIYSFLVELFEMCLGLSVVDSVYCLPAFILEVLVKLPLSALCSLGEKINEKNMHAQYLLILVYSIIREKVYKYYNDCYRWTRMKENYSLYSILFSYVEPLRMICISSLYCLPTVT